MLGNLRDTRICLEMKAMKAVCLLSPHRLAVGYRREYAWASSGASGKKWEDGRSPRIRRNPLKTCGNRPSFGLTRIDLRRFIGYSADACVFEDPG